MTTLKRVKALNVAILACFTGTDWIGGVEGGSLRSKRSRTKRTKFRPRKGVFHIRAARKMGREQKGGRKWVGERKEGNACPQTPRS